MQQRSETLPITCLRCYYMYLLYATMVIGGLAWLFRPHHKLVFETLVKDVEWQSYILSTTPHTAYCTGRDKPQACLLHSTGRGTWDMQGRQRVFSSFRSVPGQSPLHEKTVLVCGFNARRDMGGNGGKDYRGISVFGLGPSLRRIPGVAASEILEKSNHSGEGVGCWLRANPRYW
ncbi:hypothetical protein HDV63DRAFT_255102 [Trichoderma sp. SZMC 28014]